MPFVLDNSVVTGWFIAEQADAYSAAIAARLEADKAVVPALWQLEFANVLRTACIKGKVPQDVAREIADIVSGLPIEIDRDTPGPKALLELALQHGLSSYDAAYLELTLRRGLPLACRDGKLRVSAQSAGVILL